MELAEKKQLEKTAEVLKAGISGEDGEFGLKACIDSVVFSLCFGTVNGKTVELRGQYLYQKSKQGAFFNDKMFLALNLVEKAIYNLKY